MTATRRSRFSRDRHDFPNSDIIRTKNQGVLILDAMAQLQDEDAERRGEFKLLALLGRHAQLDGIGLTISTGSGRVGRSLEPGPDPATSRSRSAAAVPLPRRRRRGLFADFRDDGILETH